MQTVALLTDYGTTDGYVTVGEPLAYFASGGCLAVAGNRGHAAHLLNLRVEPVVEWLT